MSAAEPSESGRHARRLQSIEPALSPTITRKLNRVIPANLQIDARWDAIQEARQAVKKTDREQAPSPSMMIAWAVVRAMEKHAPFRRLILEDDQIVQNDDFDLGVAVALEGDRLATAVITTANQKSWPEFVSTYNETVAATRGGRVDAMNAPVVITSLGAFEVKAGAPIVVPPSVGTLFVGTAHRELISNKNKNESAEVITLSLTFDHRVVNGAGAAAFANEIKKQIEGFKIPSAKMPAASARQALSIFLGYIQPSGALRRLSTVNLHDRTKGTLKGGNFMAGKLDGKKVAILVADGFEQVEMTKPREALDEAGAQTKIVSLKSGKIQGMNHADKGDKFDVDLTVDQARPEQFDALMIPGGLFNPDAMRTTSGHRTSRVTSFVRANRWRSFVMARRS